MDQMDASLGEALAPVDVSEQPPQQIEEHSDEAHVGNDYRIRTHRMTAPTTQRLSSQPNRWQQSLGNWLVFVLIRR